MYEYELRKIFVSRPKNKNKKWFISLISFFLNFRPFQMKFTLLFIFKIKIEFDLFRTRFLETYIGRIVLSSLPIFNVLKSSSLPWGLNILDLVLLFPLKQKNFLFIYLFITIMGGCVERCVLLSIQYYLRQRVNTELLCSLVNYMLYWKFPSNWLKEEPSSLL